MSLVDGDHGNKLALVVDDEPAVAKIVSILLEEVGYTVLTAGTAEQATYILQQNPVSFALIDANLPGTSGVHLAQSVKSGAYGGPPRVYLMSAGPVADSTFCDGFIEKPFEIDELQRLASS